MKRELTMAGAACAICCAPLLAGAVVAAPAAIAVGGAVAVAAGAAAMVRKQRKPQALRPPEPVP